MGFLLGVALQIGMMVLTIVQALSTVAMVVRYEIKKAAEAFAAGRVWEEGFDELTSPTKRIGS
jgi:hypothetical protein